MISYVKMPRIHRFVLGLLGLSIVLGWTSCGGGSSEDKYRVTMVCDVGGLGDQGFNDAGLARRPAGGQFGSFHRAEDH